MFIENLAKQRQLELHALLDVACGTGAVTSELAEIAPQVVGLDASSAMLDQARSRYGNLAGVSFIQGDFRDFQLGRMFDVALCTSNSLNYVRDAGELRAVFRMVAKHLRPGGRFVFDTITATGMRLMSGLYLHVQLDGTRFAMRFNYERQNRKERAEVLLSSGTEIHLRIPIDPGDVALAAKESGFVVEDSLARLYWLDWLHLGHGGIFVLKRTKD